MTRTFDMGPAVRTATPVIVGIIGPSGTGKTYSALRLATGMQRVSGGKIHVIDTEARRALAYAPRPGHEGEPGTFRFTHVPFAAPFGPLDYLAAFEACVRDGARTVVVDSMSHEHESIGGVLEMHEKELDRMCGEDGSAKRREKLSMLAWQKPKAMRRQLIASMLQMNCNFVLCFRAKEKIQPVTGGDPKQLGWMPIAGPEFFFECVLRLLLLPGANGVPVLSSRYEGERDVIRVPQHFRPLFDPSNPRQVSEELGEQVARWSAGRAIGTSEADDLAAEYTTAATGADLAALERRRRALWGRATAAEKQALKAASEAAAKRLEDAAAEAALGGQGGAP